MRRCFALVFSVLAAIPAAAGTWKIDPAHTSVQFAVRHMMVSNVRGTFGTVSGTVTGDPANPREAVIEVTIDARSIDTRNAKRDDHLRGPDFLDVDRFPTISFRSTRIEPAGEGEFRVTGDLTLHGTTKPIVLEVRDLTPPIKDPFGKTRAGAHATTTIDRKAFGIDYSKVMDNGGLVVGDTVRITVDVEATLEQ